MDYNRKLRHQQRRLLESGREDASLLSIRLIQAFLLVLVAVAVHFGQNMMAAVLLGAVLLGAAGRIWARLTVCNVKVRMDAQRNRMFPGDRTVLSWQIKNEKFLPVLWADVLQPLADPPAMVPVEDDGSLRLRKMSGDEKTLWRLPEGETGWLFQQRCSFIGSWKTAAFDTLWQAQRRGIYTLENTRIYTGDGFGLTRYRLELESGSQKNFVIYPKIVPVHEERFLQHMWEGESGSRGVLEDLSIIKLTRPYESTDSLKRINWRLLARGQEVTVNQYEVISPHTIHFIFDGESFRSSAAVSKDMEQTAAASVAAVHRKKQKAMEASLEVLASLLMRLSDKKMDCGFSFPETDRLPAVNLFAEAGDVTGEILYRMAEYQVKRPVMQLNGETGRDMPVYRPSVFAEEDLLTGSQQVAKYYFVTYDESSAASSSLLRKMEGKPVTVLTYETLMKLKKGAGAENG